MHSESPPGTPPSWKRYNPVLFIFAAAAAVFLGFWFEEEIYTFLFSILFQWSES